MKERRLYNRKQRNAVDSNMKDLYWKLYQEKKVIVDIKIRNQKEKYEKEITHEIKSNKNNKEAQWKYIMKLRGIGSKIEDIYLYDNEGKKLEEQEEEEELSDTWQNIYNRNDNNIGKVWEESKEEYINRNKNTTTLVKFSPIKINESGSISTNKHTVCIPNHLIEHYSVDFNIDKKPIYDMDIVSFTEKEVYNKIKKSKNKKAPGPDGIQNEVYKALIETEEGLETITKCLNNELTSNIKPISWKSSNTIMIPKNKKPKADQLRPIALTDNTYKYFMGMSKDRIESHLQKNDLLNEMQAGFTKERRVEDNLMILQECKEAAFLEKNN